MKIVRFQFYPMAFIIYCLGDTIAYKTTGACDLPDSAVSKMTIADVFGSKKTLTFSAIFICFAALSGFTMWDYTLQFWLFSPSLGVIISHTLFLMWSIYELFASEDYNRRVDKLMTSSLIYIVWFGLIPLAILLD
jgi:4-hydroxybenzoate polyprenyltransferase